MAISSLPRHDSRLQSLRGLAALSVLLGHSALILQPSRFSIAFGSLFQQDAAVVFFYVLSGYVLGLSLARRPEFWPFIWRRCTRLLPVMWASILLGVVIALLMQGDAVPGASSWFNDNFLNVDTGGTAITQNLAALSTSLNGSMWSIQVELVMMAVLPFAAPFFRQAPIMAICAALAAICALSGGVLLPIALARFPSLRPVAYAYCFFIGLALPRIASHKPLQGIIECGKLVTAELAIFVAMYPLCRYGHLRVPTMFVVDAFISAHVIAYVVSSAGNGAWLRLPPLVWLGDISYSFYAYGQIILVAAAFYLFGCLPPDWWIRHSAMFTVIAASTAFAVLVALGAASFYVIERPTIGVGGSLPRRQDMRSSD